MKQVLIIGASSGIGEAVAQHLANDHKVVGTYNRNEGKVEGVEYHHYDVNEPSDLNLPDVIDALVYCPGAINLKPFARLSADDFSLDFNKQVLGAIEIIQRVLPQLKKSNKASITLFSTVAVKVGMPYHTLVSTSKGAVEGLVKALAAELAPQIRVNAIAPSLVDTPLASGLLNNDVKRQNAEKRHPLKAIGSPDDIALGLKYLVESDWVTGQVLSIDGGMSALRL